MAGAEARDTLDFAITEPVDPSRAPRASNRTERVVFGLLYEPLVGLDCRGRPVPALAADWQPVTGQPSHHVLTIQTDARYWSGAPLDPRELAESWPSRRARPAFTLSVIDASRVSVRVDTAAAALTALSDAAYAVRGRGTIGAWPLGTGAYRPESHDVTFSTTLIAHAAGPHPAIRLREESGRDHRDILDAGVDLLLTSERAAIAYAGARSEYDAIALPWDRTYVFVSASANAGGTAHTLASTLASEVVQQPAVVAAPPSRWAGSAACLEGGGVVPPHRTARIVYDARDAAARATSERLVALADGEDGAPVSPRLPADFGSLPSAGWRATAAGLSPELLANAIAAGDELGYVLALEHGVEGACPGVPGALHGATWIQPHMIVPLVQTRPYLIVRRGAATIALDGTGRVRVLPHDALRAGR